jgi:PAS domain S-box-containing protein
VARIAEGWVANGAPPHPAELKLSEFAGPLLDQLRAGAIARFDEVGTAPYARPDLAALAAIGIQAGISVPLIVAGRLVLNLTVHQDSPRIWTDAEVAMVADVAERTWAAVERAKAEAALRASEAQYHALFTSIDAGFCVVQMQLDATGTPDDYRILEINPAFERHTGLVGAVGKLARSAIPGLEMHWVETYGRVALTGEPVRFTNYAAGLDDRWFEVYAFPTGEPAELKVAILFTDITERTRAEAAMRVSEERFQQIAHSVDAVFYMTDVLSRQSLYVSPAYARLWGLTADDMRGQDRWLALVHPDDRPAMTGAFAAFVAGGPAYEAEYRVQLPDGRERWISATARRRRPSSNGCSSPNRSPAKRQRRHCAPATPSCRSLRTNCGHQ